MPDRRYVLAGLAIFLLAVSYPAWRGLALGTAASAPILAKARKAPCVLPPAAMRASHMSLLSEWRDLVVRQGLRRVTTSDGRTVKASLSGTCLDCHEKAKFCDTCHAYAGVKPECWSCHIDLGGTGVPPLAGVSPGGGVAPGGGGL